MLGDLPVELLQKIFIYVSTFDIESLASVNKYFRHVLQSNKFGQKYLANQAYELRADVTIYETITGLDRIAVGFSADNAYLVIQTPSVTSVYTIDFQNTGRLRTDWKETPNACELLNGNLSHVHSNCPLCREFGISRYQDYIDKGYRVFFQTWADSFTFTTPAGSSIGINLRHIEYQRSCWNFTPNKPTAVVSRYGLMVTSHQIWTLEKLFRLV